MKRRMPILLSIVMTSLLFLAIGCFKPERLQGSAIQEGFTHPYGVFIGLEPGQSGTLDAYRTIVIDAEYFSSEEIAALHKAGHTVYSYLNIGAIEDFRDYYGKYKRFALGAYDDWPEERWIDVSEPQWRSFLVETCAKAFVDKGIDGFFLDNADVYDRYPSRRIYLGLVSILKELRMYGIPIIMNGGDGFVSLALENGDVKPLLDGVNQEDVFTAVDFRTGAMTAQTPDASAYYQEYLARCKAAGLVVYLTEYGADDALRKQIEAYCEENGFFWYDARSIELNGK